MGLFGDIAGSIGQVLGIGGQPNYYKGAELTADQIQGILEGTQSIPNPETALLARRRQLAQQSLQSMAKAQGLSPDLLQAVGQRIDEEYMQGVEQSTGMTRQQLAQGLQAKLGVQEQAAQAAQAANASNVDMWRGIMGSWLPNALQSPKGRAPVKKPAPGPNTANPVASPTGYNLHAGAATPLSQGIAEWYGGYNNTPGLQSGYNLNAGGGTPLTQAIGAWGGGQPSVYGGY